MRPRKPLDEAIKWYKQKQLVKNQKRAEYGVGEEKDPKASGYSQDEGKL